MEKKYEAILDAPAHVSETRPRMPMRDRAAQFAPFAALTGYDAAVAEAARLTGTRVELDESAKEELDRSLRALAERLKERPEAEVCYFVPDARKAGGEYVTVRGRVLKLQPEECTLTLSGVGKITVTDIRRLELL